MNILAVDTALGACSAAVTCGAEVLAHRLEVMERGHAERLASMVQEIMAECGLAFEDLDRLAVTIGPGTFTGQRVGYAFMRGLRLALNKPLVGVTTLAAMAKAAEAESGARAAAVLHDAKRGEVYAYAETDGATVLPVQLATFDAAMQAIVDAWERFVGVLAVAGTAGAIAAERLRELNCKVLQTNVVAPDARWVAHLAAREPEPESVPRPLYLRPPDARPLSSAGARADAALEVIAGTAANVAALANLHGRCFAEPWSEVFLGRLLAQPGAFFLLARERAIPVGFAIVRAVAGEAEILSIGVEPGRRRKGTGAALGRAAAERAQAQGAQEIFLEVSIGNRAARALYAGLGFCEVGRRARYYPGSPAESGDALILRRALPL